MYSNCLQLKTHNTVVGFELHKCNNIPDTTNAAPGVTIMYFRHHIYRQAKFINSARRNLNSISTHSLQRIKILEKVGARDNIPRSLLVVHKQTYVRTSVDYVQHYVLHAPLLSHPELTMSDILTPSCKSLFLFSDSACAIIAP